MLFNSYLFLFGFLPCVLAGWWGLRAKPLRLAFLTGASWFFYAWWDWHYLPVLIGATSVDYVAGLWISRSEDEHRRPEMGQGADGAGERIEIAKRPLFHRLGRAWCPGT